jgi:hypothetical protein
MRPVYKIVYAREAALGRLSDLLAIDDTVDNW